MGSFKGIYFDGRQILKPGVYAKVNADAMVLSRLGPANTIGVIGTSLGGVPRTVQTITTPLEARDQLRGGILRSAIELMYDPAPNAPGAQVVKYYRLNLAVQAQLNLQDSVPGNVILVKSEDYGVWTNQIRIKVEAGTLHGKKITINDSLDPSRVESGDNLGRIFTMRYVGTKFASQLVVTKTGDAATLLKLQTKLSGSGDPWVDELSLDLTSGNFSTLGALVQLLDNQGDYTCTLVGDQSLPVSELDATAGSDIKTADYNHTANIGAIVYWINTQSTLCVASRVASAVNAPANLAYTLLSGGSEGSAPDNTAWQNAIDAMQAEEINLLFVCSESNTIHAMARDHAIFCSDIQRRKERLTIVGGALNETVDQVVTRAQDLNSSRAALVYPGIKRRNLSTGNIDTLSPMYAAAVVTGLAAGVTPETPLTFKEIKVNALEKLLQPTEIDRCLDRGIMALESLPSDGIFRVVQGITTYLSDSNLVYRKVAGMRAADYLIGQVRRAVDRYVGRTADAATVRTIVNATVSMLRRLTRSSTNQTGVLTEGTDDSGNTEPAFKNVKGEFDGADLVAITFEAHLVGEVAYITVVAGLTPTKIQAVVA